MWNCETENEEKGSFTLQWKRQMIVNKHSMGVDPDKTYLLGICMQKKIATICLIKHYVRKLVAKRKTRIRNTLITAPSL